MIETKAKEKPFLLNFDNRTLRSLPIDPVKSNRTREVRGACFSLVETTPVESGEVVSSSKEAIELLDISQEEVEGNKQLFAEYMCGNKKLVGSCYAAAVYCGHQFGYFSGQLGDGRAIVSASLKLCLKFCHVEYNTNKKKVPWGSCKQEGGKVGNATERCWIDTIFENCRWEVCFCSSSFLLLLALKFCC